MKQRKVRGPTLVSENNKDTTLGGPSLPTCTKLA
jgi:hypothetical protein